MRHPATLALVVLVLVACAEEPVFAPAAPARGRPATPSRASSPERPTEVNATAIELDEELVPEAPALGPPYPVVLVHGFSGFYELGPLNYFFEVEDHLASVGETEVFAPALPPYNSSQQRVLVLAQVVDEVLEQTGRARVHIIAHSQGGVDSRRLVSAMGYADRVASITTVATPHRGTPLADAALVAPDGALNPAGQLLGWLIGAVDEPPNDAEWDDATTGDDPWDPDMVAVAELLSTDGMAAFNAQHPDPEEVQFFSVAGYSNLRPAPSLCDDGVWDTDGKVDSVDPFLVGSGLLLSGSGDGSLLSPRANDGIVPTDSMVWGAFLGCVPADHFDEVGQIADFGSGLISGFDHRELFERLLINVRAFEQTLPAP